MYKKFLSIARPKIFDPVGRTRRIIVDARVEAGNSHRPKE
jgi:hypothetical protein